MSEARTGWQGSGVKILNARRNQTGVNVSCLEFVEIFV